MSAATVTLVVLAAGTYGLKAAGPVLLGGRALPLWLRRVAGLVPGALLAALVSTSTFTSDGAWAVDARIAGLAAAAVALRYRAPFVVAVVAASAATALVRLAAS